MKRLLFKVVLFLILGATASVVAAWGFASFAESNPSLRIPYTTFGSTQVPESDRRYWTVFVAKRPGWRVVYSIVDGHSRGSKNQTAELALPRWSTIRKPLPGQQNLSAEQERAFGWPWVALSWRADYPLRTSKYAPHPSGEIPVNDGIGLQQPDPSGKGFRALPLRPMWLGLALDLFFYAPILWGIAACCNALQRSRRVLRGRCPSCSYDLQWNLSLGCPECGWRREAVS